MLVSGAKTRAKQRGLPFNLTTGWVAEKLQRGLCEVTGAPFNLNADGHDPWSPSLDQIEPGRGYTVGNVQVVVFIYNIAKNRFTHQDVVKLAECLTPSA